MQRWLTLGNRSFTVTLWRYSRIYGVIFSRWFYPRQRYVIRGLDLEPEQRVLHVGVGTGIILPLYPREVSVIGVDLSPAMLREARKKVDDYQLDNVSLVEMDAGYLAFPDHSFDVIMAAFVTSVVPDPIRFSNEIKRVSKADGTIVLISHFSTLYIDLLNGDMEWNRSWRSFV
jgi:phosphatidylethanolamine/phosphatidyl-N-methylethanolamine N-methyltransferase